MSPMACAGHGHGRPERRILNRAPFTRIVIGEDEHVPFVPAEPVASVLVHARSGKTTEPGPDMKLPRHQTGQVSIFSTYVDLGGALSKLAPAPGSDGSRAPGDSASDQASRPSHDCS